MNTQLEPNSQDSLSAPSAEGADLISRDRQNNQYISLIGLTSIDASID